MVENKRVKTLEFMINNGDINAPEFIDNLQQTIKGLTEIGDDYVRCFSSQFSAIEKLIKENETLKEILRDIYSNCRVKSSKPVTKWHEIKRKIEDAL